MMRRQTLVLSGNSGHRVGQRIFRIVQLAQRNGPTGIVLRARASGEGEVHLQRVPAGRYRLELEGSTAEQLNIEDGRFQVEAGRLNVHHARCQSSFGN